MEQGSGLTLLQSNVMKCMSDKYKHADVLLEAFKKEIDDDSVVLIVFERILHMLKDLGYIESNGKNKWILAKKKITKYTIIDCMTSLKEYRKIEHKISKHNRVIVLFYNDLANEFIVSEFCAQIPIERFVEKKKLHKVIELEMMAVAVHVCMFKKVDEFVDIELVTKNNCVHSIVYILTKNYKNVKLIINKK